MCIVTATLEIHLKPVGDYSVNDTFGFYHFNSNPNVPLQGLWSHFIGNYTNNGTSYTGLTHDSWDTTTHPTDKMLLLDLSALPNQPGQADSNIINLLNLYGQLEISSQDDFSV